MKLTASQIWMIHHPQTGKRTQSRDKQTVQPIQKFISQVSASYSNHESLELFGFCFLSNSWSYNCKKKITAISITIPNSLTLAWAYMDFLPCLFSAASERRETPGILLENWLIGYLSSLQTSRDHTGKYPSVTVLGHQSSDFLFSVLDTGSSSSSSSGSPCAICW